jgi:Transposase IS66 family
MLKDTTLKQYLYDLDRRLDRIMAAVPIGEPGRRLRKRTLANRRLLFVFMTNRNVPYTNNISERHPRPSVIFRKVTNGFRCELGAEAYAPSSAPRRPTAVQSSTLSGSCWPRHYPWSGCPGWGEQLQLLSAA